MRFPLFARAALALATLALVISACSDDDPVAPTPTGDPPETVVRAERLFEDAEGVHYQGLLVEPAADVVAVEWRLEPVPVSQSGVGLAKAAEWNRAEGTEFEFVVPPATAEYDRWVLFVRAVTDRGVADESPMELSFGPDSVAPEVRIEEPQSPAANSCTTTNEAIDLSWSVEDPDSTEGPIVSRYVLLSVGDAADPCLTQLEYDAQQPIAQLDPDDERWSEWKFYDPEAGTWDPSRSARLDDLALYSTYLVAVQARDATGATTSSFTWYRNVRHYRVSGHKSPSLHVFSDFLGSETFRGDARTVERSSIDCTTIAFEWEGDASQYAGRVVEYRWGWDLDDPDDSDDPGWSGPWSQDTSSGPRLFEPGPHNFVVQCRDNSGAVTRGVYQIESLAAVPPREQRRDVLLVDDWRDSGGQALAREAQWDAQWNQWLTSVVPGFDPDRDVIDAQVDPGALSLSRLLEYKSIIWFSNGSESSYLHNVYAPHSINPPRTNELQMLQRCATNLLMVGPGSGFGMMPHSYGTHSYRFPIWFGTPPPGWNPPPIFGDGLPREDNAWLWPSAGFCVRTLDLVRPELTAIVFEEPGTRTRTKECDGLARATVSDDLQARFDTSGLVELRPAADREGLEPGYGFDGEEFYDHNASALDVEVVSRDCFVPMFDFHSRLAEGLAEESECGTRLYSVDGAAAGVLSQAYSDQKPIAGTHDFLWGFNPMGFQPEDVEAALRWVVQSDWQIR